MLEGMNIEIQTQTLQIADVPADKMQALIEQAAAKGTSPEEYALTLIVEGLTAHEKTFDEILAPFRRQVEESGIGDEELDSLFMQARRDYARESKEEG
jgi:hypothetical protein